MGDFEPRMDKWRSDPMVEDLGLQFKDAIFNKGRTERERKRAAKKAARRARWKRSWLGRLTAKVVFLFWCGVYLAMLYAGYMFLRFWWEVFNMTERVFG